jgi:hypothetical protein
VLSLLAVPALSLLFLQNRQVQTMLSKYVAERLSEELQASISLSSVSYSFLKRVQIRDLYIEDLYGDTLLYAGITKLRIKQFRPEQKGLTIRKITIEDAFLNLVIDSSSEVNITFITDRLQKPHVPPEAKSRFHITSIELENARFSLTEMVHVPASTPVDFTDLHLSHLDIGVENLEVYMDTVRMDITSLSGTERSGFEIRQINSQLTISDSHMHFRDLAVLTEGSDLQVPRLEFNFESFSDFKRFSSKVDLFFTTHQSLLSMDDLSYIVPHVSHLIDRVNIDATVHGKLGDLNGDDLLITFDDQSSLAFDFVMIGLPDFNNTFLDFKFRKLNTSVQAIAEILGPPGDSTVQVLYPFDNLGNLDFNGHFTGYPDQFVASGLLATDLGRMVMDLSFNPDSIRGVDFIGRLRTDDFKLGSFLDREKYLEHLDMDVFADGNLYKGQIRAKLNGRIDTLEINHYAYSNITLDGIFTNNTFNGGFSISDPNIKLDFLGKTDFSGEVPVYKFTADVSRIRPYFLNLLEYDPSYFASFLIETDLSGRSIDELNGEILLVNSLFEKKDAQVQLYDVTIKARNTPAASLIQVRSDLMDIDLTGQYKLSELPESFRSLADKYVNVVPNSEPEPDTSNYFVFRLDVKHINPLLDYFLPAIQIGDHSHLSGTYDIGNSQVNLTGNFPTLKVATNNWYNSSVSARIEQGRFKSGILSDSMTFGGYSLQNQQFLISASNDTAHLEVVWGNGSLPQYSGGISLHGTYQPDSVPDRGFMIFLDPGQVVVNDVPWEIRSSQMLLRKAYMKVDSFEICSVDKLIMADGVISREEKQPFHLEVENLDLEGLPALTGINMDLQGEISGFVDYEKRDSTPVVITEMEIDSLFFNRQFLGNTNLDASWDDSEGLIKVRILSEMEGTRYVEATGDYTPSSQLLDFDIRLNQFELSTLNPYVTGVFKDLGGSAQVSLTLDGTLNKPEMNGTIVFNSGEATLSYLNTRYLFSDPVRVYRNNFYLEDFMARDEFGNEARINGSISNSYIRDFYFNLKIDANNLQCMNTGSSDNEIFYGTIFATGDMVLNGPPSNIRMNVNAATNRNTALFLPLYFASEVETSDFLTFVKEEEEEVSPSANRGNKIGGLQLVLDVNVTDDAVVQLIFDPKVGDIIETRGKGTLRMTLDQNEDFNMFGDVELLQGDYLFTLENVINKRFKIEPGGVISFNGSPTGATIDLDAVYTTRAAPYNLYPDLDDTKESLKKRIPVDCHLNLRGDLQSPTIKTGISMPTADAETRNLLENSTSTEEELMKQFISLLVINNFYSVSGYGAQDMGSVNSSIAGVTASELLSNQLSNWLSQISDDFDIGVNYRPGDQITSDEVEVALSTQLLDDRIIISGNVDVRGQETNPSSGASNTPYIMGDFDVEFRITDNVSVLAFNRARDELLFETAPYKQGVGLSYREDFDNLNQLITRYKEGLTNRKKKKKNSAGPELDE